MNTGVQYLREHVKTDARIHYAIIDGGGFSPNVVQPTASVLYMTRSLKVKDTLELQARVDKIAEGAAMMTETSFERVFIDGCSNTVPNFTLEALLHKNMQEVGIASYTEEEWKFAEELKSTYETYGLPTSAAKYDESAKELVKKALAPLGEEYQALLDEAYNGKWIDVYENKGKQSGAFSCGVHGVHPYVKLNYTDTLDDAYTLAHELGHAMHSYFSSREQDYANHDYSIMVAEVASTCNEVLLTKYLLSVETDPRRRAYILNHFLEGFRTTVFRQTLFAEFERKAHEMYTAGIALTPESLSNTYRELLELYYEGADVPEIMQYEWSYIPHFYNAFYVYQYATGFSSAVAIASKILETGDASDYLRFLSLGGSDYPIEELKVAGIDLGDPQTVRSALALFDSTITELTELLG
jgi:hypothetical protein